LVRLVAQAVSVSQCVFLFNLVDGFNDFPHVPKPCDEVAPQLNALRVAHVWREFIRMIDTQGPPD
jgi:hypothetical protein